MEGEEGIQPLIRGEIFPIDHEGRSGGELNQMIGLWTKELKCSRVELLFSGKIKLAMTLKNQWRMLVSPFHSRQFRSCRARLNLAIADIRYGDQKNTNQP
ncbi:hypothetical protein P872_21320 [Rhodonellum psychrophilum GCM71 = DSM 17998]|uniref:Uncharacterized protein n=2 Tax=Rhodonellum TaxID=336827 RepID=U5BXS5_9BACT|nr:hypothetical protein [Rhodonellum psychrophilum]ERM80722.1 hypothetical protein P872_21320 [Rhodonellum psychrophilum GCM71 = DSM 17998]SDZ25001.1 hypothetical protein SAMN05444412_108115 [Rhodonellum ikkaensis]